MRTSFSKQSVILSGARRRVLLSQAGGSERSRRTSSLLPEMTEMDSSRSRQSRPAALSRRHLAVRRTSAFRQPGSFDSGSATSFGQTQLPFAFAQDDGAFLRNRNSIWEGDCQRNSVAACSRRRKAVDYCHCIHALTGAATGSAMELPQQVRSQREFGNEGILHPVSNCACLQRTQERRICLPVQDPDNRARSQFPKHLLRVALTRRSRESATSNTGASTALFWGEW